MPTGLTQDLYDDEKGEGYTLRDFALRCSRQFGALIHMREAPHDAPIPERIEADTDYYDGVLERAKRALDEFKKMSDQEVAQWAQNEHDERLAYVRQQQSVVERRRERYDRLQGEVEAWEVPDTLAELKKLMLQQLETSRRGDLFVPDVPAPPLPADEFRAKRIEKAEEDIAYAKEKIMERMARATEATQWLRELREALPEEAVA